MAKYSEELTDVVRIKFDKFRNTNVTQNPNSVDMPSLLLTGLEDLVPSELSPIDELNDLFLDIATSGLGKSRALLQALAVRFGFYFIPSCVDAIL